MLKKFSALIGLFAFFFVLPTLQAQLGSHSGLVSRDRLIFGSSIGNSTRPTITIPARTEFSIQMLSGVHTQVSHLDDLIQAMVTRPVYVRGQVALPEGTLIAGRIIRIQPAGRMRRPAELTFRFDHVTLPDGQDAPISAQIIGLDNPHGLNLRIDSEGQFHGTRGYSWKQIAGGVIGLGVFSGIRVAEAGAVALKPVLPIGTAALVGFELIFPRGSEVNIPPMTLCSLRLNYPLTVASIG
jgi:hypothetical protein